MRRSRTCLLPAKGSRSGDLHEIVRIRELNQFRAVAELERNAAAALLDRRMRCASLLNAVAGVFGVPWPAWNG